MTTWPTFLLVDDVRSAIGHIIGPQQWPEAHLRRLFSQWLRDHPDDRDRYAVRSVTAQVGGLDAALTTTTM